MTDEIKFFILLLEKYAYDKNYSTADVFREWESKGIVQEILDSYRVYHTERIENAYDDVENLLATGKHLW